MTKKKSEKVPQAKEIVTATGHHYSVKTIQKAVQLSIDGGSSLRGVEKNFKLAGNNDEPVSTPSFSSIRNWLGRIGLYFLQRTPEYRHDWVFIIDLTVELGHQKCLVILGVSQEYLEAQIFPQKRGLKHHDVQVLALEILDSTKGEVIAQKLEQLTDVVGIPCQILADRGSDLQKGIKLYQNKYPSVIYSYDVTHAMALFLKNELSRCPTYQSFLQHCYQCRNQLQQTELSFLSPPSLRSQCRYFNVERLINWAQKLLNSHFDTLQELVSNMAPETLSQKLHLKFSWLLDYQLELTRWSQMLHLTRTVETLVKHHGINQLFWHNWELLEASKLGNLDSMFYQSIRNYLTTEIAQIPVNKTLLATSDVIESIFGKYKQFSARCPIKQMGQIVLLIPLSTIELTNSLVKQALETIRYVDLKAWSFQVFGQSMLGKRRTLFGLSTNDIKSV